MRYVVDVGPGDSGVRVTIRRRLADGALGDLLGELVSWRDGVVRVRSRDDVVHEVAEGDVVAAKRIPAAPVWRRLDR